MLFFPALHSRRYENPDSRSRSGHALDARDAAHAPGYNVLSVVDGHRAYQLLQREDGPALAIIDWMMPGMDGPELCRKLRERGSARRPHVIMLTAKSGKHALVDGLDAGADDYIQRPFDVDELHARLRVAQRLISANDELREQTIVDKLTGLLGRAAILELLRRALAMAARDSTSVSVLLAEIDRFRLIQDTYGHAIRDVCTALELPR